MHRRVLLGFLLVMTLTPSCSPMPDPETVATALAQTEAPTRTEAARREASQATHAAATEIAAASQAEAATSTAHALGPVLARTEVAVTKAAERRASATAQAQPMADRVERLVAEGYLADASGKYTRLEGFFETWAQIDWYQWWPTDQFDQDFVVRADIGWDTASMTANWWNSGCGFVFREHGEHDHYLSYLALDGNVYLGQQRSGNWADMGHGWYGKPDLPFGDAEIMLVVDGSSYHFFVNDELVHTRDDLTPSKGELGLTMVSGTNVGFGTRCSMTNIDYWALP